MRFSGVLFAMLTLLPSTGRAQIPMFGGQPVRFIDPMDRFSFVMPPGWLQTQSNDPNTATFKPPVGGDSFLAVRVIKAPSASSKHLLLRAIDERLKQTLPNLKLNGPIRTALIGGAPSATVSGSYAYQGNEQYLRAVEETVVVAGGEAFIFHFQCFLPHARGLSPALELVYRSFQATGGGGGSGSPFETPKSPSVPTYEPPLPPGVNR